jgi:hypothetical protein
MTRAGGAGFFAWVAMREGFADFAAGLDLERSVLTVLTGMEGRRLAFDRGRFDAVLATTKLAPFAGALPVWVARPGPHQVDRKDPQV